MSVETLQDLLEHEMKDLMSAEEQLVKALPKVADAANSPLLREAVLMHLEETRGHVERLNQAFELLGKNPDSQTCKAMKGLLQEGKGIIKEDMESHIKDQALIGGSQRIEHYEIAAYGTARTLAERLGQSEIASLLQATLDEEAACDKKLTQIAESLDIPDEAGA